MRLARTTNKMQVMVEGWFWQYDLDAQGNTVVDEDRYGIYNSYLRGTMEPIKLSSTVTLFTPKVLKGTGVDYDMQIWPAIGDYPAELSYTQLTETRTMTLDTARTAKSNLTPLSFESTDLQGGTLERGCAEVIVALKKIGYIEAIETGL